MLCCAPGNQHVFYTTINKRPPIVFLRRSRRISCTGVPCRNPSVRDPSRPAQDDKSGAVVLSQRQGWGPGGVGWSAGRICRCPAGAGAFGRGRCRGSHRRAGARPRRPLSGSCAPPSEPTAPPSLSLRTSAHAGVAIRSPASRKACAPRQGRTIGPGHDRPHGRCNAFALLRGRIATSLRSS